jgi:hypothetical protein
VSLPVLIGLYAASRIDLILSCPRNGEDPMETVEHAPGEALDAFVRRVFCVSGPDGIENGERLRRAIEAVAGITPDFELSRRIDLPDVPGVPRLRYRIDEVSQIPEAVRRFLPEVEANPRLHTLSFVDPLRLATEELGIAVSPVVARAVRRGLAGAVSFDLSSLDAEGRLQGMGQIHWRPKSPATE